MTQEERDLVRWNMHLASPPERVFDALATDEGRASFLAETSRTLRNEVHLTFPNGFQYHASILEARRPTVFRLHYLGGPALFELSSDGNGGTDLALTHSGVAPSELAEVSAGWVSVLMTLKARVDHGIDLRNHDSNRSWDQGYADN